MPSLKRFYRATLRLALKWRNRRSQRRSFPRAGFYAYLKHYPLPQPRSVHDLYTLSPVKQVFLKSRMWEIHKSGSVRDIEVLSYG